MLFNYFRIIGYEWLTPKKYGCNVDCVAINEHFVLQEFWSAFC